VVAKTVYLFTGQDSLSKDIQLKQIKKEFFTKELEQFNFDILYAKELTLKVLQEKLLCFPVKSPKRIVVLKDAQLLKEDIKDFILEYVKNPHSKIILILDMNQQSKSDKFTNYLYRYVKTYHFKETPKIDTFTLSRSIELRKPDYALLVLNQLLKNGERPERILGGLRYVWEKEVAYPIEMRKRLKLLLNCDIDIKTGRLQPTFALEKLVIGLCSLTKSLH